MERVTSFLLLALVAFAGGTNTFRLAISLSTATTFLHRTQGPQWCGWRSSCRLHPGCLCAVTGEGGSLAVASDIDRARLFAAVRKAARLGFHPGEETLKDLTAELQRILLLDWGEGKSTPQKGVSLGNAGEEDAAQARIELIRVVVRDLALLNYDPGVFVWEALEQRLMAPKGGQPNSGPLLSMPQLASLIKSLAVLGVPPGSHSLLASLLSTALAMQPWDEQRVADQLHQAGDMLESSCKTHSLQSLVRQLRDRLMEEVSPPVSRRESSSELHLRVLDSLTSLGLACEAEVAYAGMSLDVVLWPMSGSGGLRPLVLEIDGPQHFLDRDPSRPTGPTLSRRRLLNGAASPFQGIVPLTWLDLADTSAIGVIDVVEARVMAELGLSLDLYRCANHHECAAAGGWDLAKRLVSVTDSALMELVEEEGSRWDGNHMAVMAQRLYSSARRQQQQLDLQSRRRLLERLVSAVEDGMPMRAHCLALILRCLAFFRDDLPSAAGEAGERQTFRSAVVARILGRGPEEASAQQVLLDEPPSWAVAMLLESMSQLGWRVDIDGASAARWHQLVLAALRRVDDLEAPDLVRLIASLGSLGASRLLQWESLDNSLPSSSLRAALSAMLMALDIQVIYLQSHQLVDLVRGILQLGLTVSESLEEAILRQAGSMAPHFSLDALAVVMLREPAIGDGETSLRARRKAVQSRLGSEVRSRLRSMKPTALLRSMERLVIRQKGDGFQSLGRGFVVMWCSEVFRRRSSFTKEEKGRVVMVVHDLSSVYDPGKMWVRKFER